MTLLIDINVILDVALERAPFAKDAARLLVSVDRGRAKGYMATHTVTTLFYVVAKNRGADAATRVVSNVLRVLDVVPADRADLQDAISLGWKDFEDAVQAVCASKINADLIVTRDLNDFKESRVPAADPAGALARLAA